MISPDMFDEFVMPVLREWTEYFDYTLYHLDGVGQMRFLDELASLENLNGIQWNPEPDHFSSPMADMSHFRAIRDKDLSLFIPDWCIPDVDAAAALVRELGPDGLFIGLPEFEVEQNADHAVSMIQTKRGYVER
jgi:hypothetical protein